MVKRYESATQYKPGPNPYRLAEGITMPGGPRLTPPPSAPNLRRPRTTPGQARARAAQQETSQLTNMLQGWSDRLFEDESERVKIEAKKKGLEEYQNVTGDRVAPPELKGHSIHDKAYYAGAMLAHQSAVGVDITKTMGRIELDNAENPDNYSNMVEAYRSGVLGQVSSDLRPWVNDKINSEAARGGLRIQERALRESKKDQTEMVLLNAGTLAEQIYTDAYNLDHDAVDTKTEELSALLTSAVETNFISEAKRAEILLEIEDKRLLHLATGVFAATIENEGLEAAEDAFQRFKDSAPGQREFDTDGDGEIDVEGNISAPLQQSIISRMKTMLADERAATATDRAAAKATRTAAKAMLRNDIKHAKITLDQGLTPNNQAEITARVGLTDANGDLLFPVLYRDWNIAVHIKNKIKHWRTLTAPMREAYLEAIKAQVDVDPVMGQVFGALEKVHNELLKSGKNELAPDLNAAINQLKSVLTTGEFSGPDSKTFEALLKKLDNAGDEEGFAKLMQEGRLYDDLGKLMRLSPAGRQDMINKFYSATHSSPYATELYKRFTSVHEKLQSRRVKIKDSDIKHATASLIQGLTPSNEDEITAFLDTKGTDGNYLYEVKRREWHLALGIKTAVEEFEILNAPQREQYLEKVRDAKEHGPGWGETIKALEAKHEELLKSGKSDLALSLDRMVNQLKTGSAPSEEAVGTLMSQLIEAGDEKGTELLRREIEMFNDLLDLRGKSLEEQQSAIDTFNRPRAEIHEPSGAVTATVMGATEYDAELYKRFTPMHEKAQREREEVLRPEVQRIIKALESDQPIAPEALNQLLENARGTDLYAELKHAQALAKGVDAFQGQTLSEQEQILAILQGTSIDNGPQAELIARYEQSYKETKQLIDTGFGLQAADKDGLLTGDNRLATLGDVDVRDPDTFYAFLRRRLEATKVAEAHYQRPIEVMNPDEVKELLFSWADMSSDEKLMALSQMVGALGDESFPILEEIGKSSTELAMAGALMRMPGGGRMVAREIVMGIPIVASGIMGQKDELRRRVWDMIPEGLYVYDTDKKATNAVIDATIAVYATGRQRAGALVTDGQPEKVDENALKEAFHQITGGSIELEWDESSMVWDQTYTIPVPVYGMDGDDFREWMDNLTIDDINSMGGVNEELIPAADVVDNLRSGKYKLTSLVRIGSAEPGKYLLKQHNGAFVPAADGSPFVLDFGFDSTIVD